MSHTHLYPIRGEIIPTPANLTAELFLPGRDTPGNVGLCFSGGGSFALLSAMGQMRALRQLGYLGKARAISSVSGGSWATVPFTFLPDNITDDDFLGRFVADPHHLTLNPFGARPGALLEHLPRHNLARVPHNPDMSVPHMVFELFNAIWGPPVHRRWCHFVGDQILGPFGLSAFEHYLPQAFFAHDDRHAAAILEENPHLTRQYHRYHARPGDTSRPLHVCNFAQFVAANADSGYPAGTQLLAPVQSTAFYTGIWGQRLGLDAGGRDVGGGALPSFAYNSTLVHRDGVGFTGQQDAPLALSDITGMSSAFFATSLAETARFLGDLDPVYMNWPVTGQAPASSVNRYADAGCIENNGVASVLAFTDIDKLVVFMNSPSSVMTDTGAAIDVDFSLPTLFGHMPLEAGKGYVRYEEFVRSATDDNRYYEPNRVFPPERFDEVIEGLWQQSGSGSFERPAVYLQRAVEVLDNPWYGVVGNGRKIDILWVKTGPVQAWREKLREPVKALTWPSFPEYIEPATKLKAHYGAIRGNLHAHLTSWVVAQQADLLAELFAA